MNPVRPSTRLYPDGTPVSYWLIPAPPDQALLRKSIDVLARDFRAPAFDPHITLFSTVLADGEDPAALLTPVAAQFEPMRLTCGPTGHSGLLFKTLFVEFSYQAVSPIANAIRDRCRHQSSYRLEPHLSLLYRALPAPTRQKLAEQVSFSGKGVRFGSIAAVTPGAGLADFQEVASWNVCATRQLSEPITVQANTPE